MENEIKELNLSQEGEEKIDAYLERIAQILWFYPSDKPHKLKKNEVDKKVKEVLKAFGVQAEIEYQEFGNKKSWGMITDGAWSVEEKFGEACDNAFETAKKNMCNVHNPVLWVMIEKAISVNLHVDASDYLKLLGDNASPEDKRTKIQLLVKLAEEAADRAIKDLVASGFGDEEYKKKYPNGNFVNFIPLWKLGLIPAGVVENKFIIYVPSSEIMAR